MAVTSIWPIKYRTDQVIYYVENPEKTVEEYYSEAAAMHSIGDVLDYAADDMKTERREYVTCLNCEEETAIESFLHTKQIWDKTGGRLCYHAYQSFKHDEVSAATAHEIGVELAKRLWGDRFEVVIATHCNTGHYHSHFVINSVSFMDGLKFYNSPADYRRFREESDQICKEYGLSVIESNKKNRKPYNEWQAEKNGKPTLRGMICADIDKAVAASLTQQDFFRVMRSMGYMIVLNGESGAPLKYPKLKPRGAKGFFRFHKLGEGYDLEHILDRVYDNARRHPLPENPPRRSSGHYQMRGNLQPKITGLRALYFRYCYELHIIKRHPEKLRVPFSMREDMLKLERYSKQAAMLGREQITTMEELAALRSRNVAELSEYSQYREELRNKLRRQDDPEIRSKIKAISAEMKRLRQEITFCDDIAARSEAVAQELHELNIMEREEQNHEQFRRCGRTGRADRT